uniref:Uncharacterized protein n=1 Tax=Phytophthora ramorum TaxID=164328 RepID=H3H8E8_PHYRM
MVQLLRRLLPLAQLLQCLLPSVCHVRDSPVRLLAAHFFQATPKPSRATGKRPRGAVVATSPHESELPSDVSDGDESWEEAESAPATPQSVEMMDVSDAPDYASDTDIRDDSSPTLTTLLLADNDDDLNTVASGDNATEYGAMDSGDEPAADDIEDGESEDNAERGDDAAELQFAESFLACFGGEEEVLAGKLKDDVLRLMATDGWEGVEEPDTEAYLQTPYVPVPDGTGYPGLL